MTLDRFDPTMTLPDQVHTELRTGQIIYAIPAVNVYRVDVEGVSGIQEAYYSGTFGGSLDWTRNGITLTPGSRVKVNVPIQRDGSAYSRALAEIISVNPFYNKAPATDDSGDDITFTPRTLTRWLFPASSQHILEEGDWGKYSVARGWNVGTREDAVAGEWSQSTSSGSILRVNPLEAAVKACEQAGVEAHRIDKMLRMVGFNLEMMSGGALERRLSDRGEYSSIRAEVPYLWEAPGGLSEGDWSDDVPRHVTLTGHAGDLRTETIQLPPAENDSPAMRVLTEQMSWDGGYYLEGAGEIMMGRARPAEPITLERFLCNYMPERPAGGVPGDEYDGSGDAPPEPPGDWSFTGAITVDGTDYTPPPADESDPSGLDMGNFSAYAIGKQTAHRREQRLRALAQNIACDLGDEVTLNESGQITVEGADHRSDAQLYLPGEQEAFWKWTSGSTWVLKNGETEMVVGPYTSQFYGNKELATFARVNCMGGDVVNMHSRYRTNVRAMDVLVQPRQSAIVNNLVRGEWTPSQSVSNWVNGGVTLYEWADGGWNQIGSASASGHVGSVDIKVSELSDPVDGTDPLTGPVKACVGGTDHYLEGFLKGSGAGVSYSVDIVDVTPAEPNLDYDSCSKDIDVKVQVYTGPDDDRTPVEEADVVLTSEGIEFEDAEPVAATDAEGYVTFTVTITQWGDMRLRAESRGGEAFHSLTVTADDGCKEPDYWDLAAEITSQPADGNISCDPYVATVQVEAEAELYAHSGATTPEQTRTDDVWVSMWVEPNYCDSITSPQAVDEEGRASFDVGLARADVYTAHVLVTDEVTGLNRVLVSNSFTVTEDEACTIIPVHLHSTDGGSVEGSGTDPDGNSVSLSEGVNLVAKGSTLDFSHTENGLDDDGIGKILEWTFQQWEGDYDDSTVTVTGPMSVTGVFGLEPPDAVADDDIIVYNSSSDEWEHKSTPFGDAILMHNGGSLTWSEPPGTGDYIPVSVDGDIQWMEINDADCSTM